MKVTHPGCSDCPSGADDPGNPPAGASTLGAGHGPTAGEYGRQITELQAAAWSMANMSYHAPDALLYRSGALELYREDLHDRIAQLFAVLDAQNAAIDAALDVL